MGEHLKPCPLEHNPLFFLVDHGAYTSSMVVAITGPKRSGKSLLLARMLLFDMLSLRRKVWSTMTVKTTKYLRDRGEPDMKTMPLDFNTLYVMSEEYSEGTIGIDESVNIIDRRNSTSMKNKLLNGVMNQVGHRNLNVYYTVKAKDWLDGRFQFETDIEIRCFDLARSPWGRSQGMPKGEMIRLEFYDHSGAFTGHMYNHKWNYLPFKTLVWEHAHNWWDAYDTKEIVTLEEIFTPVRMDMKARVISNREAVENDIRDSLLNVVQYLKRQAGDIVDSNVLHQVVKGSGLAVDSRVYGRFLKELGVTKKQTSQGYVYNLSKLGT